MGNVVGSVSSGFVDLVGKIFGHPLDFLAGKSCNNICGPTWDLTCYIENFCIAHLAKLLLVSVLLYLVLVFIYLLKKLGVFHCIYHAIYRFVTTCFFTCFYGLECCCTSLCSVLDNHNKRRRRRRGMDIESAVSDGEESEGSRSYQRRNRRRDRRDEHGRSGSKQEYLSKSLRPRSHRTHLEIARKTMPISHRAHVETARKNMPRSHQTRVDITSKSKSSNEVNSIQDCDNAISPIHHVRVARTSKFANKKQLLKHSSISRQHGRHSSHL